MGKSQPAGAGASTSGARVTRQTSCAAKGADARAAAAPDQPGALAKRTHTLASLQAELQECAANCVRLQASVEKILSTMAGLQEQQQQQREELLQLLQQRQQQEQQDGALPSWQGNVLAMSQQLADLEAGIAAIKQQVEAESSTTRLDALAQELADLKQQQQQQQQQLAPQQRQPARFMAHAPVSMGGNELVATLAACGGIASNGITAARMVWFPRSHEEATGSGGSGSGADGEGGAGSSAAAGSSGGAGSSSEAQRRGQRAMCLWEVTLASADLLSNMLGGRIRSNLRRGGHSIYVDHALNEEERQQRKALQQRRRELQQQGVRTRWSRATLMQWRRGGADGRRGSWEEVVPPLPAEVPGSGCDV